jgi:hypothetical protein
MDSYLAKPEIEEIISNDIKQILDNDIVYKYSSYDIGVNNILLNKTLKFSHPSTFNDPFDCNEKLLKLGFTEDGLKSFFNEYKTNLPKEHWEMLWEQMNDMNMVEEFNKNYRDNFKISCFSARSDEVLMWSHYANKHSGVCIGFDFPYVGRAIN